MKLMFLGTSAGRPTKARNVTSIALSLPEPQHGFWLFDTGEGTQHRLLGSKLKLNKLERIFITHLHGDHLYGLPGLLTSRSYFEGAVPLQVYGPPGLRAFIDCVFHQSGVKLGYDLEIIEIESGQILKDDYFTIEAAELEHRMQCFGFRIIEHTQPGKLNLSLLDSLGVPWGPLYGKLKQGEDVTLPNGDTILSSNVVGPSIAGRVITILGDTRPCVNAIILSRDADLIVHEGTFAGGMEEKAATYGHSTVLQAAEVAVKANVKQLVMTHFSSRFDDDAIVQLVQDAQKIFANTSAAHDYLEISIGR